MGYSGSPITGITDANKQTLAVVSFVALALYSAVELNVIVFSTFRRFRGLYFWSFLAATNGIIPHSVGFFLKNVVGSADYGLYITLVAVGWVPMVTGQALVLYSRLHLIFWNEACLRAILGMIVSNVLVLHVPIIVLMYGANSSPANSWVGPYVIYEKIQVTFFFLQELIISAVYIRSCFSFFDTREGLYGDAVARMRRHLLLVNVFVILLDVPILFLEYLNLYDVQTAYKAFVYGVKLKIEFRILNRLVELTSARRSAGGLGDEAAFQIENVSPASSCQRRSR